MNKVRAWLLLPAFLVSIGWSHGQQSLAANLPLSEKAEPRTFDLESLEASTSERQKNYLRKDAVMARSSGRMGGVDSGSGTLVLKDGSSRLLDFYNFPAFGSNQQPSLKIRLSQAGQTCQLETFSLRHLPHGGYVEALLGPVLEGIGAAEQDVLESALGLTPFAFVNRNLAPESLDPKSFIRNRSDEIVLIPAAFYQKGDGVLVSLPLFNGMSFQDQLGLLVHEILRQASIGFELSIPDKELQQLTVALTRKKSEILAKNVSESFSNSKLPAELFTGLLTSFSVRADLNSLCAWMENRGNKPGPACQSLESADANDIYKKIPAIKAEVLNQVAASKASFDPSQSEEQRWNNLMLWSHRMRQDHIRNISVQRSFTFNLFTEKALKDSAGKADQQCSEILTSLENARIIQK
jgi:hypothetical protein